MGIPVIDLFAGPGGLGEGFSSIRFLNERLFDIKLSIEKEKNAHQTLQFRSFYRQFPRNEVPQEYYDVLKEKILARRNELKVELFEKYKKEGDAAKKEAWHAELGSEKFSSDLVDSRIRGSLDGMRNWVLIGGPPCQAFSLAGRSRVGGIDEEDHRVYLYKEYLRIIAVHHPALFVMENVKGLLSAKVNGEKVFSWILRDLMNPSEVFEGFNAPRYRIYSLTTEPEGIDLYGNPVYRTSRDYLIKSELYYIPQKRHRVILLGVREDIDIVPGILDIQQEQINLEDVIGDLPRIRSGLNRSFVSSEFINGKKRRLYKNVVDSQDAWEIIINNFRNEILTWNGCKDSRVSGRVKVPAKGIGSEYIKFKTPKRGNPLTPWFYDPRLQGVCNHESRSHLVQDLKRYLFGSMFAKRFKRFPRIIEYEKYTDKLLPDHLSAKSGKFADRFRVQLGGQPATTITSHISKDGHYYIHYDPTQCRSLTVREAARVQTFPDNYLFCGSRTRQYHQVGNAVPPFLANQIGHIVYDILSAI